MTTPTTPDLAAIAEKWAKGCFSPDTNNHFLIVERIKQALTEATAPLQAKIDEQGRGLIDAAHRLALAQSELTTLRAYKEILEFLEKYLVAMFHYPIDGFECALHFMRGDSQMMTRGKTIRETINSAIQNEKGHERNERPTTTED